MSHTTKIIHSEKGNVFVAKIKDLPQFWQIILTIGENEEIISLPYEKDVEKITHTTGEK
jgi:hypothetical protein